MSIASNIKIGPRVLAVVALLSVAAAVVGYMGVTALDRYERQSNVMENVARQAIFGERLNALVYAVVMDSAVSTWPRTPMRQNPSPMASTVSLTRYRY